MEAHPITAFSTRLHQVLDEVLAGSTGGLDAGSAGDAAVLLSKAEARISALRLRLLDQARRADTISAHEAVTRRAGGPRPPRSTTAARVATSRSRAG